jgi:tetratricopeptide (TPR) repeat protein
MNKEKKDILIALVPAIILGLLFLISWTDRDFDLKDDWYAAISIVDSARLVEDPNLKKEYLDRGGNWILELKEKYPFHPKLRMFVGYYFIQAGKFDEAIAELEVAIEEGKGGIVNQIEYQARDFLTNAVMNKTQIMMQQKQFNEAIEVMRKSLPSAPEHLSYLAHFANVFAQANNPDSTLHYYEKVIRINPNYGNIREQTATLYFNYGNAYAKQNLAQLAYEKYLRATQLVQTNPHYFNNLANVELQLGKIEESIAHFKKAVEIDPNNQTFQGNLKIAENKLISIIN